MHYCYSTCVFMCISFGVARCPFRMWLAESQLPGLFTFCRVFALGRVARLDLPLDVARCAKKPYITMVITIYIGLYIYMYIYNHGYIGLLGYNHGYIGL